MNYNNILVNQYYTVTTINEFSTRGKMCHKQVFPGAIKKFLNLHMSIIIA